MIINIDSVIKKDRILKISFIDRDGGISMLPIPIKKEDQYVWELCSETDPKKDLEYRSWDGRPVKKEFFKYDKARINKYRVEEILKDYRAKYPEMEIDKLYEFNVPRKHFIDIEVEVIDGFPSPETAPNRVVTIAIASSTAHKVTVLGLKPLTEEEEKKIQVDINVHFAKFNDKWSFEYVKFENEYEMLYHFFHAKDMFKSFPCISGWNVINYDWKYLLNRCKVLNKINKKQIALALTSPENEKMDMKTQKMKVNLPDHQLLVDYMEIYKKWDKVIKIRENDKLDFVGLSAVGIQKIKYNGSIKELFEKDYMQFVFYNAVDSVLVHYIDQKLNTMLVLLKLAYIAGVEIIKAFSPIWLMETVMCGKFLEDKKLFVHEKNRNVEQRAFEGAYVMEPVKGLHNWIVCMDFASLYPNTIRQFNLSPETCKGKNVEAGPGEITTANHMVYDNTHDSVLREIITDMYGLRRKAKDRYLAVNKEIDFLKKHLETL